MACGGCSKKRKKFAHKVKTMKRGVAKADKAARQGGASVAPEQTKKKRRHSKRGLWLKQKRRAAKEAKRKAQQ